MAIDAVKIQPEHQSFLDNHFGIAPQWGEFHKKLNNKEFVSAVQSDTRSDDKLKAFVQAVGMRDQSRRKSVKVPSDSSGSYKIRYHPGANRFSCTCQDWTYKRSVGGGDCKHIERLNSGAKDKLMKLAGVSAAEVMFRIGRTVNRDHKDKAVTKKLQAENSAYTEAFHRPGFISQWLKHAQVTSTIEDIYRERFLDSIKLAKEMSRAARYLIR